MGIALAIPNFLNKPRYSQFRARRDSKLCKAVGSAGKGGFPYHLREMKLKAATRWRLGLPTLGGMYARNAESVVIPSGTLPSPTRGRNCE